MAEGPGDRVQKLIARAGLASRRQAEELIAAGRVTVNGRVISLGGRADPSVDRIEVDGVPIDPEGRHVVYALHKPPGVMSTVSDPEGRVTVAALVPREPRVFPIGRLDADSEGLLLLTNDGALAQLVAHPSHGVEKTYLVEVKGALPGPALGRLRKGVDLDDGTTAPAGVKVVGQSGDRLSLEITLHEGRNRQVRRMVTAVGSEVVRLVRIRVGPVQLGRLKPGQWRNLSAVEIDALRKAVAGNRPG